MTVLKNQFWFGIVWAAILLAGTFGTANAGISWNVSKRSDAKIISLNKGLMKKLTTYSHLKKEPMFLLLADQTYKVEFRSYRHIRNQIYYITDASAVEEGSRQFFVSGSAKIKETGAWRQRGKKIEKLDDSAWEIIESDGLKEIHFAPTSLKDGDIVGFSMETEYNRGWRGSYIWLAADIPIMMSRTRIKSHNDLAYHISGYHLPRDGWSKKNLAMSHEVAVDVRMTVVDIPAIPEGPWTPTEGEYLPYLYVSRRGTWAKKVGAWFYNVSWNEVAHAEMIWCDDLAEEAKRFSGWARQRTRGAQSDADKADILHRFVRDEVVTISSREVDFEDRDMVKAFNDRQATSFEKGRMLYALCRSIGIEIDLLAGRSDFQGAIDMADPTAMQLVQFVVRLNSEPIRYYAPEFDDAAAGRLPARFMGVKMLLIPTTLPSSPDDLWKEMVSKSGGNLAVVWNGYRKRILKQDWARWERLPGRPLDLVGTSLETVHADSNGDEYSYLLTLAQNSSLQLAIRSDGSEEDKLEEYLEKRYPVAEASNLSVKHGVAIADTLVAAATLSGIMLPPAGDSEWLLPAAAVYGEPLLSGWNSHDGDPFIVRGSERRISIFKVPLPAQWESVRIPGEFYVQDARLNYQSIMFQEEGELVVMRTLMLNKGITMGDDLAHFRETLQAVQAHERNPILIQKQK